MTPTFGHTPVLLEEVLKYLVRDPNGIYVDATFGRGGHASRILQCLGSKGVLLALDKDPEAVESAAEMSVFKDPRFLIKQGSFAMLKKYLIEAECLGKVKGILFDLGVSSPQLDNPERGFSFSQEGPLDMRMDHSSGMDAATWINAAEQIEIQSVLKKYGEERDAFRIARAIVQEREKKPIRTTGELAGIIAQAKPRRYQEGKHPATRSFQAIRIFINHELEDLEQVLPQCVEGLAVGGRLAVISFHSLEDRIVKQFIVKNSTNNLPIDLPIAQTLTLPRLGRIGHALKASSQEVAGNSRARSAILRITEKLR
jgi:16S rRNA (cytosine1402-N4)-methyltransferase